MSLLPPLPRAALAILFATSFAAAPLPAGSRAPLADAAERRDRQAIEKLLLESRGVNAAQPDGMTALHWAVLQADSALVARLLEAGAMVDAPTRYGVRPLHLACQNGDAATVERLLAAGADVHQTLVGDETPLMTAARTGIVRPVEALIAQGANVNSKDHRGQTALMWAAAEGHAAVARTLLTAGAEPGTTLPSGFTALLFAVREGRAEAVEVLLDAGADVNQPLLPRSRDPRKSTTALLLAVENGHFELAAKLLDRGARPNDAPAGYAPLHAITWVRKPLRGDGDPAPAGSGRLGSLDLVRALVGAGANVNARLERGQSGRGKLTTTGATPFFLAARTADLPLMELLIELGADPALTNRDQTTPLLAATGVGALGDGDEAAATEAETLAAVRFLLARGADINAVDSNGETAMHGAAYQDRPEVARFLAAQGADVQVWHRTNQWGWTPWLIAEGHRPGNFRPAPATIEALRELLLAAGITPPPPTERTKVAY